MCEGDRIMGRDDWNWYSTERKKNLIVGFLEEYRVGFEFCHPSHHITDNHPMGPATRTRENGEGR